MTVLVGADPEVFVKAYSGKFVSAFGMINGTKRKPLKVNKGAVQVDGNALEFNIDPAHSKKEFIGNIKEVYRQLQKMVPGYNLVIEPTAVFDKDYFDQLPWEAKMLGCDPDYNAWLREENIKPETDEPMRTAGGHIHVGWRGEGTDRPLANVDDANHFDDCCIIAKQLDYYLGLWSLGLDKDSMRRTLYGKAGTFRPKPYGMEYRSLSNFWIASDDVIGWTYDQVQLAIENAFKGNLAVKGNGTLAQEIIDNNDYTWPRTYRFNNIGVPPPGAVFDHRIRG